MCWKYWQKALQSLFDDTDDIAIQLSVKNPLYTCNNTHIKILIDYMNMLIFLFHKFNYWIRDVSYLTVNHSTRICFRIICDVANHDNERYDNLVFRPRLCPHFPKHLPSMLRHEHWLLKAASQIGVFDTHVRDGWVCSDSFYVCSSIWVFLTRNFQLSRRLPPAGGRLI